MKLILLIITLGFLSNSVFCPAGTMRHALSLKKSQPAKKPAINNIDETLNSENKTQKTRIALVKSLREKRAQSPAAKKNKKLSQTAVSKRQKPTKLNEKKKDKKQYLRNKHVALKSNFGKSNFALLQQCVLLA